MLIKRLVENHTVSFLKFVVGMRGPASSVSGAETALLTQFARGRRTIVEVGVFEGVTSQLFCKEVDPLGTVYLVDPFFPTVRVERLLHLSFNQIVATKAVQPFAARAKFVRLTSREAAETLPLQGKADFIFIDARHDYESVLEDFKVWTPMLAANGAMAFHDSRVCPARDDIAEDSGPVRLMREIASGLHGRWDVAGTADSLTVLKHLTV